MMRVGQTGPTQATCLTHAQTRGFGMPHSTSGDGQRKQSSSWVRIIMSNNCSYQKIAHLKMVHPFERVVFQLANS